MNYAKIFYVILGFYLVSLLTSTAGQEFFGWLIFLLFIFDFSADSKKFGFKNSYHKLSLGIDRPILFFGAWAMFTTLILFPDLSSLHFTLSKIRWIFMLYGFSYLLKKYFTTEYEKHFKIIMSVLIFVGFYGIVQMFTRIDIVRSTNVHMSAVGDYYRAIGFFNIPLTYAYCIGMVGFYALIAFFIKLKEKKNYILPLIATLGTLGGIIASSTRGAWIACFTAVMIVTYILDKKKAALVLVISLVMGGAAMFVPTIQHRAATILDTKDGASNSERIRIWKANFAMFKDHPIIGVGLEKSKKRLGEYYAKLQIQSEFHSHAHNDILYMMSGVGIPGTLAFLWFCFYFVRQSYLFYKNSDNFKIKILSLGALGAQIYFFIGGFTQCNFTDNEVNHILIFTWALLVGISSQYSSKLQKN